MIGHLQAAAVISSVPVDLGIANPALAQTCGSERNYTGYRSPEPHAALFDRQSVEPVLTLMVNSIFNSWRLANAWLDN